MGLSACQTMGAPEKNAAFGAAQSSSVAATLGVNSHQAQSPYGSPKQATRPDQSTIIGVAF
jgi:hypothetical protein